MIGCSRRLTPASASPRSTFRTETPPQAADRSLGDRSAHGTGPRSRLALELLPSRSATGRIVDEVSDATFHQPGEGERIDAGKGSVIVLKATGETTGRSLFMAETTIAPGFPGPPLHTHQHLHDMFYVLEGVLTIRLGDATHEATAGSFVCVPPGIVHTFSNAGTAPVRFLNMNTPSGFEHYMRELGQAAKRGALTPEVMGPIASRYDFRSA